MQIPYIRIVRQELTFVKPESGLRYPRTAVANFAVEFATNLMLRMRGLAA
jgi:hypothetical protein